MATLQDTTLLQGSPGAEWYPALWDIWIRSLSWEDPLEEGMATHRGAWRVTVHGVTESHTHLSD